MWFLKVVSNIKQ